MTYKPIARRCAGCGGGLPFDTDDCFRCEVERRHEARRLERRRLEEEARLRLGDRPLTRSLHFIRYGILGAEEGIQGALRHARGNRAAAVQRCAELLARARAALDESEATFKPRWPAP